MAITTEPRQDVRIRSAVPVGIALIVAELLLALLWYPWVVDHLVFNSSLPFEVLRLLIVLPEYLLLALAVWLVARRPGLRLPASALALLAALVSWGSSVVSQHIADTLREVARHHDLLTTIDRATLVLVPTLGVLAWGVARRRGLLWLVAVPIAPALHYWIQHSQWPFRLEQHLSFRGSEVVGMSLVIVPVLLAVLAGWALEQVGSSRTIAA